VVHEYSAIHMNIYNTVAIYTHTWISGIKYANEYHNENQPITRKYLRQFKQTFA